MKRFAKLYAAPVTVLSPLVGEGDEARHLAPLAGRGRIASAIRVRGSFRKGGGNDLKHAGQIAEHLVIPKSQDPVIVTAEPFIANGVARTTGMLASVYFDNEAGLSTNKVDDIKTERLLSDEFLTTQPARAQTIPELPFRVSRRASQTSCPFGFELVSSSHAEHPPHPSCFARRPLPADGERRR